jgi:hypothetical protein
MRTDVIDETTKQPTRRTNDARQVSAYPAHAGIQAVQRAVLKMEYLINALNSRLRGNDS